MKSRTENSIRNTGFAILGQIVSIILSFATRTVFINHLGASYLGINGLFTNVLFVLSFAELGFGTAIVYELYKPLADNDEVKIAAFMNFYAQVYRTVGVFILIAGLCFAPFLDFFIGDRSEIPTDIPPLYIIYILYLLNSSFSYFFNYKRTLIIASQNGYIDSLNTLVFSAIRNVIQMLVLVLWSAFIPYLLIQIFCTILGNVFISIKADRLFPYLGKYRCEKIASDSLKRIVKNVVAMASHKLGSVIVSGTDNILISKFVGVVATGYYSNYTLLTSTVRTFYIQLFSSVTASVGNFVAEKSKEDSVVFFNRLLFLNFYIALFCTSCLSTLINPFIALLWGEEYVLPLITVSFIMINFYITCMRQTSCMFIDTSGLFWQIRWKSIIEAFINLVASIILVKCLSLGIIGVIIGTTISTMLTNFWWEPYVVCKYTLEIPLRKYMLSYVKYTVILLLSVLLTYIIELNFAETFIAFGIRVLISVFIPNALLYIIFKNTDEYQYFLSIINKIMCKYRGRNILRNS